MISQSERGISSHTYFGTLFFDSCLSKLCKNSGPKPFSAEPNRQGFDFSSSNFNLQGEILLTTIGVAL
jgi:hypothetical protein